MGGPAFQCLTFHNNAGHTGPKLISRIWKALAGEAPPDWSGRCRLNPRARRTLLPKADLSSEMVYEFP